MVGVASFLGVAAFAVPAIADDHPLGPNEQHLAPFLDELLEYRDSPIARRFILMADTVDVVDSWLENLIIPLFLPGGKLALTDLDMHMDVPLQGVTFPTTLQGITISDLNNIKNVSIKLLDDSKFTWAVAIELSKITASIQAQIALPYGDPIQMDVEVGVEDLAVQLSAAVAFDRTRICGVWGDAMLSSINCVLWPVASHEEANVSGANITDLAISLGNLTVDISAGEQSGYFNAAVKMMLPEILANISSYAQMAKDMGNDALLHQIPKMQESSPCEPEKVHATVNVSQVCVSNNGGYTVSFGYHDCPAHLVSSQTPSFPIDQSRCMDVKSVWPDAAAGHILRVETVASGGLHEIIDPRLRYVPDSNAAAFQCGGTTLTYKCDLLSVTPVDPSVAPPVSKVCIINHAGFVMSFKAQNKRTDAWVGQTGTYPINQQKCIDLGSTQDATEGDLFKLKAHAVLGKDNAADRLVQYSDNGLQAAFECRGTTLNYECKLLVGGMSNDEAFSIVV